MKLTHFVLGLATGIMLLTATLTRADALDDIEKQGVLRVAVPQNLPPFGSLGADRKLQGLDIDVANLVAAKMGVKAELLAVTSTSRLPALLTGKADLLISSVGKSPEREKAIAFTAAYAPFFNGVFGAPAQKVSGPADLAGKTIGVTRGSVEDIELSKIAPATAIIKRHDDNYGTIHAFQSGQVQLIATGNVVAAAIIARNPGNKPETKFLIMDSPCFIGLNKNEKKLQDRVNAILAEAKKDGSLNALSMKWLGMPLPANL